MKKIVVSEKIKYIKNKIEHTCDYDKHNNLTFYKKEYSKPQQHFCVEIIIVDDDCYLKCVIHERFINIFCSNNSYIDDYEVVQKFKNNMDVEINIKTFELLIIRESWKFDEKIDLLKIRDFLNIDEINHKLYAHMIFFNDIIITTSFIIFKSKTNEGLLESKNIMTMILKNFTGNNVYFYEYIIEDTTDDYRILTIEI